MATELAAAADSEAGLDPWGDGRSRAGGGRNETVGSPVVARSGRGEVAGRPFEGKKSREDAWYS